MCSVICPGLITIITHINFILFLSFMRAARELCVTTNSVLFLQNVFSCYRACCLPIECVLFLQFSLVIECVLFSEGFARAVCYDTKCSLTIQCVLLRQKVFCYDRMCSLTIECVLFSAGFARAVCAPSRRRSWQTPSWPQTGMSTRGCHLALQNVLSYYRMASLTKEYVLSYYRMCSLTIECVLLLQNVFSYYRMCSLTIECVLVRGLRRPCLQEVCHLALYPDTRECVLLIQNMFSV